MLLRVTILQSTLTTCLQEREHKALLRNLLKLHTRFPPLITLTLIVGLTQRTYKILPLTTRHFWILSNIINPTVGTAPFRISTKFSTTPHFSRVRRRSSKLKLIKASRTRLSFSLNNCWCNRTLAWIWRTNWIWGKRSVIKLQITTTEHKQRLILISWSWKNWQPKTDVALVQFCRDSSKASLVHSKRWRRKESHSKFYSQSLLTKTKPKWCSWSRKTITTSA